MMSKCDVTGENDTTPDSKRSITQTVQIPEKDASANPGDDEYELGRQMELLEKEPKTGKDELRSWIY